MQAVDAIIMVKSVKMPSLKGGEVDILVQNSDMDGIKLHEKLFVFGSYADMVTGLDDLLKNKITLATDLSKSLKIKFIQDKIFTGCLDSRFDANLIKIGSKSEMKELIDALKFYNENERGFILEKRINKATEQIKNIFRTVVSRNQLSGISIDGNKISLATELLDASRSALDASLSSFINQEKDNIIQNCIFTTEIIAKIDERIPIIDNNQLTEMSDEIKASDARSVTNYEELNIRLRKKITQQIKSNFINLVLSISQQKIQSIEAKTQTFFLAALSIDGQHVKRHELLQKVNHFIETHTESASFKESGFQPLVERFTVDLIDTMMGFPLGSDARKRRFDEAKAQLYTLRGAVFGF